MCDSQLWMADTSFLSNCFCKRKKIQKTCSLFGIYRKPNRNRSAAVAVVHLVWFHIPKQLLFGSNHGHDQQDSGRRVLIDLVSILELFKEPSKSGYHRWLSIDSKNLDREWITQALKCGHLRLPLCENRAPVLFSKYSGSFDS